MRAKSLSAVVGLLLFTVSGLWALPAQPDAAAEQVIQVATKYAESISFDVSLNRENVVDLGHGKWLFIWTGATEGSPGSFPMAAMVEAGPDGILKVTRDVSLEVDFNLARQFERIIEFTPPRTLLIEYSDWGPDDAGCCPTMRKRATLCQDDEGSWRQVQK